jgi:membrane associated rhomboid family serine protease
MPDFDSSYDSRRDRDHEPLTVWSGYPVYAATLLVGVHVAMLLFWMFAAALHQGSLMFLLSFHSVAVLHHGWLWQPLTYALVHPPSPAGAVFGFAVEMYFLWTFGRELERFFGRRLFLQFYAGIWLLIPALHLLLAWLEPQLLSGSRSIHFAVFIAFATLYPNAQLLFGIAAKWFAILFVAAEAISDIANNQFLYLLVFGLIVAAAYYFVRYQRGEVTFPKFRLPRAKPKFHVVPRPAPPVQKVKLVQQAASMDDVDALLDKIARTGINSLSAAERARLERASADLKKRP